MKTLKIIINRDNKTIQINKEKMGFSVRVNETYFPLNVLGIFDTLETAFECVAERYGTCGEIYDGNITLIMSNSANDTQDYF